MVDDALLRQFNLLEPLIRALPKGMSKRDRRRHLGQWTFEMRMTNPDFVYWEVLSTGKKTGEVLNMAPSKKQTYLYSLLRASGSTLMATCRFEDKFTTIQLVDHASNLVNYLYKLEISY